jgi:hypothetical protein
MLLPDHLAGMSAIYFCQFGTGLKSPSIICYNSFQQKMRMHETTTRSAKFDEGLIRQVKRRFEEKTGWGNSESWNNQDFLYLSEWIQKDTGVGLSHVTLKRFWGKVRYDSNPSTHTVNTLVQFLGYKWWRDFWGANNSLDKSI